MNILILSKSFYPTIGGIQTIARLLAEEFTAAGEAVTVLTAASNGTDPKIHELGFQVIPSSKMFEWRAAINRADIVLSMNISLPGTLIGMLTGTKVVTVHQNLPGQRTHYKKTILPFLKRVAKERIISFTENVSCSNFVASNLKVSSKVIPNSYDREIFVDCGKRRSKDFVFCGRLNESKGVDIAIRAFDKACGEFPDATLTIVGDGPERDNLQQLAASLVSRGKIEFVGFVTGARLVDLLNQHRCMLIPSIWDEPFGIVALEGIACCDTVISSDRGGLPEAVGACGKVLPPEEDVWSVAMREVLESRLNAQRLSWEPPDDVRDAHLLEHSRERIAARYLNTLREISAFDQAERRSD